MKDLLLTLLEEFLKLLLFENELFETLLKLLLLDAVVRTMELTLEKLVPSCVLKLLKPVSNDVGLKLLLMLLVFVLVAGLFTQLHLHGWQS